MVEMTPAERRAVINGTRKYLTTKNPEKISLLLQKLEGQLGGSGTQRLPFLLRDVGYTDDGKVRIQNQHQQHRSSNKIMNLFEAVCRCDERIAGYSIQGEVVFLCFRKLHAKLGEIMFSLLGESYVETGRGFNGVEAGHHTRTLDNYDSLSQW